MVATFLLASKKLLALFSNDGLLPFRSAQLLQHPLADQLNLLAIIKEPLLCPLARIVYTEWAKEKFDQHELAQAQSYAEQKC